MILAPRDCLAEDVRITPVVITELELADLQRQIFLADLVEGADHAALDQRPKAFDCVGVNRAETYSPRL
jgi:hypothetical protein